MSLQILREEYQKCVDEAKAISTRAESEKREMTEDEGTAFDKLLDDAATKETAIKNYQRKERLTSGTRSETPTPKLRGTPTFEREQMLARQAFSAWCKAGVRDNIANIKPELREAADYYEIDLRHDQFTFGQVEKVARNEKTVSHRALSVGTNSAGGYWVPTLLGSAYEQKLAYFFSALQAFTPLNTETGANFDYPNVDDTSNAAAIVTEGNAIGTTTDPTANKVTFKCFDYFSPIVKVSFQELRDSVIDIPSLLLNDLFPKRHGRAMDTAIVSTNAGTTAPQGILNGTTVGVNLAVSNALVPSKLIDLEVSVDKAYRSSPGTGWLMHDATWGAVRKMSDDNNNPLIQFDLQNGVSPKLLGYPVYISNNMPSISSPGDNQPLMVFGYLPGYFVRRVGSPSITRLDQLYAGNGQVGFVNGQSWDARHNQFAGYIKTLNSYDS